MRITAILPVAGVVGGIYSAGFLFGYNYHKRFSDEEAASSQQSASAPTSTQASTPPFTPPSTPSVSPPPSPATAEADSFATNKLIYKFGLPVADPTLHYASHVVLYDQRRRIPRWVAETLTEVSWEGGFGFTISVLAILCLFWASTAGPGVYLSLPFLLFHTEWEIV